MDRVAAFEDAARACAEHLADPWRPSGCPDCLHLFFRDWAKNRDEYIDLLRAQCHGLWHAMIAFLTLKRTAEEREALSGLLVSNICAQHRQKRAIPTHLDPEVAQTLACQFSLYLIGAILPEYPHDLSCPPDPRPLWPIRRSHCFPFGVQASVESILDWFCVDQYHQQLGQLLTALIMNSRQRVLPVLMSDRNRARLLHQILRILRSVDVSGDGETDSIRLRNELYRNDVRGIAYIFRAIMRGQCASPCDEERYTGGIEDMLAPSVLRTLHLLDGYEEQQHLLDLLLAFHRRGKLPRAALPAAALLRMPGYIRDFRLEDEATMRDGGPFAVMLRYMRRMWFRVDCAAPDCGKHGHESTTGHMFPVCERCRFVTYCSRACQKRDWARPGTPHREICDILRAVFTFASMAMEDALFIDACHQHDFPVSRAMRLTEWIANVPYRPCI